MDGLPVELLDFILDFVEINRQTFNHGLQYEAFYRDFHSLSLTSKTLHRVSQPRLYRHFQSLHGGRGVVKLVRTICQSPKLSQHLEVIDVAPSISPPSTTRVELGSQQRVTAAEMSAVLKIVRTLGRRAVLNDAVVELCSTAWMLILLSIAHDVKSINIRHTDEPAHRKQTACKHCPAVPAHLPLIFAPARLQLLPAGAYSALHHISIEGNKHPGEKKTYASALSSILRLPAVESLECINFAARQELPENWSRVHRTSALKTVEFRYGNLDALSILDVVNSCTSLEVLTIVWKRMDSPMHGGIGAWCRVDIRELMLGLETHQHTLRSLSLTNIPNYSQIFVDQPASGSLRHFEKLEDLAIDEFLLAFIPHWDNFSDLSDFWEDSDLDHLFPSTLRALTIHSVNFLGEPFFDILRGMSTYHGQLLRVLPVTFPRRNPPQNIVPWRNDLAQRTSSFVLEEREIFNMPRVCFEYRWADGEERTLQKCLPVFADPEDPEGSVDSEESEDV